MTPHVGVEKENLSQGMEVPPALQVCEPHFLVCVMGVGFTYSEMGFDLGVKIEVRVSQGGEEEEEEVRSED